MAFHQHLREQTSILLKKHFVIFFKEPLALCGCLDTGSVGLGEGGTPGETRVPRNRQEPEGKAILFPGRESDVLPLGAAHPS